MTVVRINAITVTEGPDGEPRPVAAHSDLWSFDVVDLSS